MHLLFSPIPIDELEASSSDARAPTGLTQNTCNSYPMSSANGSESPLMSETFEESAASATYVHPSLMEMVATTYREPHVPTRKQQDPFDPLEFLQIS